MKITNRGVVRAAVAVLLVAAVGCERADPRLKNLTVGITKDSVGGAMEKAAPRKTERYLVAGQNIETLYFQKKGKTDPASLEDRNMSPLVMVDDKLAGWGWDFWDSVATAHNIKVAKKQ